MFTPITGRAVVVTGATRGIGKGIARVFASSGARVLIVGRDEKAARATVDELSAGGAEASCVLADVSSREDCKRMADTAVQRMGGIDVLCANAGIFPDVRLGFMRTAAIELAPSGITVNAVLPGNVITEGLADLGEAYIRQMAASIPMRRLGTVDEIGHTALFLATDEAGFITGQTIDVDGGQVLPESLEAVDAGW